MTESMSAVNPTGDLIIRRVRVNRARGGIAALQATGRTLYGCLDQMVEAPRGIGDEVEVCFFRINIRHPRMTITKLEEEYAVHGFAPADMFSLAAINEADPAFADEYPNMTLWRTADGWCYAAFEVDEWDKQRDVYVGSSDKTPRAVWYCAGIRK